MRPTYTIVAAIATASGALLAGAGAGPAGQIPPRPEQIEFAPLSFEPPAAKAFRRVTKGGVPVYMAPSDEFPLVQITFTFKGGSFLDPPDKVGLADMTGDMIRRGGTATIRAEELDEKFDFLAANCTTRCSDTDSVASLNCLKSNLDEAFGLFIDMLRNPGFQKTKVDLWRSEQLEQMKQRNDDAGPILNREWSALLYGPDHFEAREPTQASIDGITESDMRALAAEIFNPGNLIVGVTGDFDPDAMLARLDKAFEGWPRGTAIPDPPAPTATLKPGVYYVEKDIPQGKVYIGLRSIKRDDPDYFATLVMNEILGGGGFTSRITKRVRSDEGLAYSAGSRFLPDVYYPGELRAGFQSKSRTVALATKLVLEELERIRSTPVSAEELETAKNSFIETFPRTFESKNAMINLFIQDEWTKRDPNYWKTYREKIGAVTAADVQRVAQKYLDPGKVAIVIVGKWEDIAPGDLDGRAKMAEFFGGQATELPLRDPLTMRPMPKK